MAQLTGKIYDESYMCEDLEQQTAWTDRRFTNLDSEQSTCVEVAGLPAGSASNSSVIPDIDRRLDLDGQLRGLSPQVENKPYYNRDQVGANISGFEEDLVAVPYCDKNMEPIHTRQEHYERANADRIFDLGKPPNHPWERTMPEPLNSRDIARDAYHASHPEDCACPMVVKSTP